MSFLSDVLQIKNKQLYIEPVWHVFFYLFIFFYDCILVLVALCCVHKATQL